MKRILHITRFFSLARGSIGPSHGALAIVFALLVPGHLRANDLEAALRAALDEKGGDQFDLLTPAIKLSRSFELFSHSFRVEPVEVIEKQDRQYTMAGKLTHLDRRSAVNETIAYRIIRTKNGIKSVTWQLNGGEWTALSDPIIKALKDFRTGRELTAEQQREQRLALAAALQNAVDESWQRAAEFLIAHIAVRHC